MTEQEKALFEKLRIDREENARVFEKPSVSGTTDSWVNKYSDQAHFIYELIQNADDARASKVWFLLETDRLIFAHNGQKHFSISDPAREKEDKEKHLLGDINAITSAYASNKDKASIGKFGIGFKSVFQYTNTPHIYDTTFQFKIERFVVPVLLKEDHPLRKDDETLFEFPFDKEGYKDGRAYEEISQKLNALSYPLLFMTNLKSIDFEVKSDAGDKVGLYEKEIKAKESFNDIKAELICLSQVDQSDAENLRQDTLWLFSSGDKSSDACSVGFFLSDEGKLKPVRLPAFCFFPTKVQTGLNFIIHAPFLLTDSREGIKAGEEYNKAMIKRLAELSASSIVLLKEIGVKNNTRLIGDDIFEYIPYKRADFEIQSEGDTISFMPFYDSIKNTFSKEIILPTKTGYASAAFACWASVPEMMSLFSDEQLCDILGNKQGGWVFISKGRDETQRNKPELYEYISGLRVKVISPSDIIKLIKGSFIQHQKTDWLHRFYKWLSDSKERTDLVKKTRPVFLNQNKKAVAAKNKKDRALLFLPVEDTEYYGAEYDFVCDELLKNEETKRFLTEKIDVKKPELKDYLYNFVISKYNKSAKPVPLEEADKDFKLFLSAIASVTNRTKKSLSIK